VVRGTSGHRDRIAPVSVCRQAPSPILRQEKSHARRLTDASAICRRRDALRNRAASAYPASGPIPAGLAEFPGISGILVPYWAGVRRVAGRLTSVSASGRTAALGPRVRGPRRRRGPMARVSPVSGIATVRHDWARSSVSTVTVR
jgi:hypothetical protein